MPAVLGLSLVEGVEVALCAPGQARLGCFGEAGLPSWLFRSPPHASCHQSRLQHAPHLWLVHGSECILVQLLSKHMHLDLRVSNIVDELVTNMEGLRVADARI